MFFKMKMLSLKKASVKIIILIIAGVMGILMFQKRTFDYFLGPEEMTAASFEYEEGKYVRYNLDDVIVMDCFLERKDRNVKGNIINYYYYILGIKDAGSGSVRCIVVMTDSNKMDIYNDYNRYLKNRIKGKLYDSPEPYTDTGTLVPISALVNRKFVEYLDENYGVSYGERIYLEPYCIIPYKPGIIDISVCLVSGLFVISALVEFIIICSGLKQRKIKKFFLQMGRVGLMEAENDYEYSRFFSKSIRIGDIYTYLFFNEGIKIIENKKILWVYECTATGKSDGGLKSDAGYSGIQIWDSEFNCYEIFSNDKRLINSILDYIATQFSYIIVGYNQMLSNLYFNDNSEFKNLVYNKYSGQNEQNGGII
ncbi:MAG: hypothetical protein K2M78_16995 [Lachnospiraceae bacterium]|nr:hypothetical protein [Lachnospiraceae bacterium]